MKNSTKLLNMCGVRSTDEFFNKLSNTFKDNITTWDYFVNWNKVFNKIDSIEIELNLLNYLVGKNDREIKNKLRELLFKYPRVIRVIPAMVAFRDNKTKVLISHKRGKLVYKEYEFSLNNKVTNTEINNVIEFIEKTGFLELLKDKKLKNLVDYVIGIEVGLDSNARKNRTGKLMEDIVAVYIKEICRKNNFDYLPQATSQIINKEWGINVTVDKSSRIIDFAVKTKDKLFLIETNFYAGGGSKLKSTAGEYKKMFDYWKKDGHNFIWITDGKGWKNTLHPLRETFDYIDFLLNLDFVANGTLESILKGEF